MKNPHEKETGSRAPLPRLGGVMDFLRLIWAIDHQLQTVSKAMERRIGLSGPQRFVLRIVGRFPGIAAGQVARIMHLHPATLTSLLHRLERRGLLRRKADPADRRRALLQLTAAGRKLDVLTPGTVEAALGESLSAFSDATIECAREVLAAIETQLAAIRDIPADASPRARRVAVGEDASRRPIRPRARP